MLTENNAGDELTSFATVTGWQKHLVGDAEFCWNLNPCKKISTFFIWFHIRSSHMIYFIYIIHLHIFHGNIWAQNWPAPNVSGFIAQLVERRTGIARSRVQAPLKSWIFFRLLYAIAKIAIITARIILSLISYPQFTYDLFHMHHSPSYLSREHMSPKLTCSQR